MTPDASPGSHRWRWAALSILCVTLLLVSLDLTILNVALPSIVRGLHATSSQLQWIVDAYAVAFAGLLLTLGALGDRVGRKWVFLAGLLVFAAGSAFSAFSGSVGWLTAGRVVMGAGAAALMPCTLSILTNVFSTDRDRGRAIGIWSATAGLGVAIGPILGGFLLVHYWWGSVFLINVPIAAAGGLAAIFLVPNSRNVQAKKPDPVGMLLSVLGFGLLLWAIIEAPGRTWGAPPITGALAASAALIAGFIVWEHRRTDPMLPVSFFRQPPLLRSHRLARAGDLRPAGPAVPHDPVPAVRPRLQRLPGRACHRAGGAGAAGHRAVLGGARPQDRNQVRDRARTAPHRARPRVPVADDGQRRLPLVPAVLPPHRVRGRPGAGPLDRLGHGIGPQGRGRGRIRHQRHVNAGRRGARRGRARNGAEPPIPAPHDGADQPPHRAVGDPRRHPRVAGRSAPGGRTHPRPHRRRASRRRPAIVRVGHGPRTAHRRHRRGSRGRPRTAGPPPAPPPPGTPTPGADPGTGHRHRPCDPGAGN